MSEFNFLASVSAVSVKAYYDITSSDYDNLINAHLLGARSFVEEYCRDDFQIIARVNEKPLVDRRSSVFYLKYYPVTSITSLVEDGTTLVEDTDYYVDKTTGRVEKLTQSSILNPDRELCYWNTERNSIVVNYIGGTQLTDDVISVVKELAGIRAGIKKRTYTDNEGIERVATLTSLPKEILDILSRHRKRDRIL